MPRIRTAHKFNERHRTGDVLIDEHVDFSSLLLSADVLRGLNSSGFERPSPIQLKAIPLGRCGLDLIAQAKSGTGKTCVFSVIALESIVLDSNSTQVLALAPTREIAFQIKDVLSAIGSEMGKLQCHAFIGGISVEEDKKALKKPCHVAVGTPGRIKFLIENNFLKTESVRLFILDEADKLLEDSFQEQINWIFSSLPPNKQMMAFSATYPEYLANHLTRYMREPTFVRLNATDPTLQGIQQFYQPVPSHSLPHKTFQEKVSQLLKLLSRLSFHQCLVFSNYQIRAQSLSETLCSKGWPSVFIAGSQTQTQRLKAMEKLKQFKCRVLISTDLTSRGIDAEHVNLVVNMDIPRDSETYLHRIGRAGRFGTQGVAVTFVAYGDEERLFKTMEQNIGVTIALLPDSISQSVYNRCSSELACIHPTAHSVEVNILKGNSATTAETSEKQLTKSGLMTNSEVTPTCEENCQEVIEGTSELTTISEKKDEQCLKEYEGLPRQKLGPFEPAQRSHDRHLPQQNGDIREARLNVQDCQTTGVQNLQKVSNVEDEQSCLTKPVENESTSYNDDFLVKLQQWKIDGTRPGSPHEESEMCLKNDHCSEEECDVINLSAGLNLEDSCTHHQTTNNTTRLDLYKNVSQILTEGNTGISAFHKSTSMSSNESCHQESNSAHHLLPSAAEFDRDFSDYLQSAKSFLIGQENDFIDKSKLPVPSDCGDDCANQMRDTDSISHARNNLCCVSGDVADQCDCKKDDFIILESHSQSTDVPFIQHQNQRSHELLRWEQMANGSTCFHLPEKCNFLEFASPSLWNWDSQLSLSHYFVRPFDDGCCRPYNLHGYHYEDWRPCGSGFSPKPSSKIGYAAMLAQDTEDTGHENNVSNHEYQWNTSWYHAYWRQTNFLRHFLWYTKSCRF